jgi:hypothetical protein
LAKIGVTHSLSIWGVALCFGENLMLKWRYIQMCFLALQYNENRVRKGLLSLSIFFCCKFQI